MRRALREFRFWLAAFGVALGLVLFGCWASQHEQPEGEARHKTPWVDVETIYEDPDMVIQRFKHHSGPMVYKWLFIVRTREGVAISN